MWRVGHGQHWRPVLGRARWESDIWGTEVSNLGVGTQIVAHSVGTWVAYEFMQQARTQSLPLPRHAFLSAMAAPDLPPPQRPWRRQATLDEAQFQVQPLPQILLYKQ